MIDNVTWQPSIQYNNCILLSLFFTVLFKVMCVIHAVYSFHLIIPILGSIHKHLTKQMNVFLANFGVKHNDLMITFLN